MARVPLVDVRAAYLSLKEEIDAAMRDVISTTSFINGPDVRGFEAEFAGFSGAKHAVGVASGTAALHLALHALGVGPGDLVVTTPHTFIATAEAISVLGARPRFVDVDRETGGITAKSVANAAAGAKAILPVHLYGMPVDMIGIREAAAEHGIPVVEDAAQSHGAEVEQPDGTTRRVGAIGEAGCFSFYPGKNLGCFGDGGAVTTDDVDLAERIRRLRDHGRSSKYEHEEIGYGYRLDTIQAAILRVKLRHLDAANARRRQLASVYTRELSNVGDLVLPPTIVGRTSVFHLYVLRTNRRDALMTHLQARGIGVGTHYPVPLHLQRAYSSLGHHAGDFPQAEAWAAECLSLPLFPEMTSSQQEAVVAALHDFFR